MWSLFGELLCVTNLEHPLPYRWRIVLEDDSKRRIKLMNSIRILREISERYPNFKISENFKKKDEVNFKKDP